MTGMYRIDLELYQSMTLDRHGGSTVSQYLRQELHGLFESVDKTHIPELYLWIKDQGGYFKRFRGGALTPWIHQSNGTPPLDLEARATQAFFEVGETRNFRYFMFTNDLSLDRLLSIESEANECGATASVAILHSLDTLPFFSSRKLILTVAHVGLVLWFCVGMCLENIRTVMLAYCFVVRTMVLSIR
jgi:protein phosphatase PTC6